MALLFTYDTCDVWACTDERRAGGASSPVSFSRTFQNVGCDIQSVSDTVYRERGLTISGALKRFFLPATVTALDQSDTIYDVTNSTLYEIIDAPFAVYDPITYSNSHWEVLARKASYVPTEITTAYVVGYIPRYAFNDSRNSAYIDQC